MTYEEIVLKVREGYENADAREIHEHIAVQVNIEGEGSGAFYIEVAERSVCVEPYDYFDRDALFTADGETLVAIASGELTSEEAVRTGRLSIAGDPEKVSLFAKIKLGAKKAEKKATEKAEKTEKKVAEKKPTAKKTEKKATEKKPAAKKETEKKAAKKPAEKKETK